MSYKKVGGLHFVRIGRFGFSWFLSRKKAERAVRDARRNANLDRLRGKLPQEVTRSPVSDYPRSFNPYFER